MMEEYCEDGRLFRHAPKHDDPYLEITLANAQNAHGSDATSSTPSQQPKKTEKPIPRWMWPQELKDAMHKAKLMERAKARARSANKGAEADAAPTPERGNRT